LSWLRSSLYGGGGGSILSQNWNIYNPSNADLSIKTEYQGNFDVEIISLSTEREKTFERVTGNEIMDITDLPKGDYLVIVWVKGERVLETRLVKNE
jgi:hypothetical protein